MISQSSTLLNTIQEELNSIPSLVLGFDTLEGPSCDIVAASQFIERSLNKSNNKWIIPAAIYADLTKFGISGSIAVTWKGMQPLFKSHTRLAQLASKRSPATIAYESSFTTLYNKELNRLSSSVVEVGRLKESDRMMLEKSAQNYAESSIGSLPPRADTTISIQAIFLSLRIRARLIDEAQRIDLYLSTLPLSEESTESAQILENKAALHRFIGFVVDSSLKDVCLLINAATESKSSKKVLQGQLEKARLQFQRLELDVKARIAEFGRKSPFNSEYLCQIVNQKEQEIIVEELEKNISFFRNSAGGNVTTMKSNDAFISAEIEPSRLILEKDFEGLIKLIKDEPFYQAVTKEERAAIALAIRTGAQPGLYQSNATW